MYVSKGKDDIGNEKRSDKKHFIAEQAVHIRPPAFNILPICHDILGRMMDCPKLISNF